MSNHQNDTVEETAKEAMEEAGLVPVGKNDEGEMEYLGTEKEWEEADKNV